jgi:thioredoxin 1
MTPDIEALHAETGRAYSLDISQHVDLAREIGIRATPTVLVVKDGTVQRSVVGAKDRKFLTRLLAA